MSPPLIPAAPSDRSAAWMVLAMTTLTGGAAVALTPLMMSPASTINAWLLDHFVWSSAPLAVVQFGLTLAVCFIPLAACGFGLATVHALSDARGRFDARFMAWAVAGAALGCAMSAKLGMNAAGPNLLLLAASLPLLMVALASSTMAARSEAVSSEAPLRDSTALPATIDHWPRLLRASIVAVGGGGACAMVVGTGEWAAAGSDSLSITAAFLLSFGAGLMLKGTTYRQIVHSVGGFGCRCGVAGLIVGIAAFAMLRGSASRGSFAFLLAAAGVATIGSCVSFGFHTLMERVAAQTAIGALTIARLLVCAAVTVWLSAPWAVDLFGPGNALMMLAISLIALGGLLIVHESDYAAPARRLLIGLAGAVIAAMLIFSRVLTTDSPMPSPPSVSASDSAPTMMVFSQDSSSLGRADDR